MIIRKWSRSISAIKTFLPISSGRTILYCTRNFYERIWILVTCLCLKKHYRDDPAPLKTTTTSSQVLKCHRRGPLAVASSHPQSMGRRLNLAEKETQWLSGTSDRLLAGIAKDIRFLLFVSRRFAYKISFILIKLFSQFRIANVSSSSDRTSVNTQTVITRQSQKKLWNDLVFYFI